MAGLHAISLLLDNGERSKTFHLNEDGLEALRLLMEKHQKLQKNYKSLNKAYNKISTSIPQ